MRKFRENGAIGALLDEYERALKELKEVISDVSESDLVQIVDSNADRKECSSIQSILSHVVQSGYTYVIMTRKWLGEELEYRNAIALVSIDEYIESLDAMFAYNEKLFEDHPQIQMIEHKPDKKILARWGQIYDVDQLYEHAIMHVLRHRRQIEKFKMRLKTP